MVLCYLQKGLQKASLNSMPYCRKSIVFFEKVFLLKKITSQPSPWASALFEFLPPFIRKQLLLYRESDDSGLLSQIETEKLLAELVDAEMNKRRVE
ncbi:pyrophosphate--fructose 6-phosphate 1-phosphotransferase subunit alpha [Tanacetum coccineum]